MAASINKLLMNIDFPVFIIESIGPKHFIVGGGGGPSATGVPNGLEIVELIQSDGKQAELGAKSVCKFNSGKYAIMNCGIAVNGPRMQLACGHDEKCFVYSIKQKIVTPRPNSPDGRLRKRKSGLTQADDFKNAKKVISFDVQLQESIVTDYNKDDAYQSCAVYSQDGTLLATAGADGHIRMWKHPELTKIWETHAHDQEVDAMHIDPSGKKLCSTSKDGKLIVWNAEDGTKISELAWASQPSIKYKHKACRFCMIDRDPQKTCLFSIEVPVANKKGAPCFISQWNVNSYKPMFVQSVYMGSLACMALSSCGNYVAVGSMEGEVAVYDTANIKRIYYAKNAHKTFVTGLAFSPSSTAGKIVTNHMPFTLLSISIDNQLKIHQGSRRSWRRFKIYLMITLILVWMLLTFFAVGLVEDIQAQPIVEPPSP